MKGFLRRYLRAGTDAPPNSQSASFVANEHGWIFMGPKGGETPAGAYLEQLVEEGLAHWTEAGAEIPWDAVYELLDSAEHASSLPLLSLPAAASDVPVLVSRGTPSSNDFAISVEGWRAAQGDTQAFARTGAVLDPSGRPRLLPEAAYKLLAKLEQLATSGAELDANERLLLMGRIQERAREAGAIIDRYLEGSPVLIADELQIDLRDQAVGDTHVLEVIPRPKDAPDGWLTQFDSYDSVRPRYDVVAEQGITHVVLTESAQQVGAAIKQMPARRLGGHQAAAFLQNPYVFLGDDAERVIPPEAFEHAKRQAGFVEWELHLQPEDGGWGGVLIDPAGERDDEFIGRFDIARVREFLVRTVEAREAGLFAVRWEGHDIGLSGVTLESLVRLKQASVENALEQLSDADDWFDLNLYSDRVVGFDGQVVLVPRVARPAATSDWLPDEDISLSVDTVDVKTGDVRRVALTADDVAELTDRVNVAERERSDRVSVPKLDRDIPTAEGRAWVDGLKEAASSPPRPIQAPKDPEPGGRPGLRILHNIEQLEYAPEGSSSGAAEVELELPSALRPSIQLMRHQEDGVAWMQARMRDAGVRGILLADDMGLGKTLQCLCLMAWYRESATAPHPCLVVAPVSLLENWKAEIDKFLDGSQGTTTTLYGEHLTQYRLRGAEIPPELRDRGVRKALRPGFADGAAFVLTTYETLRDYQLSLAREKWGILVCDEAQKIKTPGAMVTRAAKAMQAEFKIACTGTPVENSLADLWCLFDFFQPGLLDSLSSFTKVFRQKIEQREDGHDALVDSLRSQISPWVLRRMKSEVADLQPKTEVPCELSMSPLQRALYGGAIQEFRQAVERDGAAGTAVLGLLHRLRMICANPLSVEQSEAEFLPVSDHVASSPKLAWLLDQLAQIEAVGEKVIVFSEFREIQRLVQRAVASRFGFQPAIVNGSTSVDPNADASRQAIIDAFQEKPGFGVIVLSTTAVGFGVNIQAANHVIHFTRPWNPAKEDQATDRAYRIGQEREVFVYCPTMLGEGFESFEQRVAERLAAKRSLSADMLAPEQGIGLDEFADLHD